MAAQRGRQRPIIRHDTAVISPFEIEEALLRHVAVGQALAFELQHAELGGAVGAKTWDALANGYGNDCVLGERSALMGLSTMKKGSVLAPMAQGAKGMQFEAGKTYVGNPADARAVER